MKILISHVDLDGYGVNVLQALYKDAIPFDEILNKNYGFEESDEIKSLIKPDNEIVITDLSIPEDTYLQWKSVLKSFIVIDHHESSKYLSQYEGNIWSDLQSGTSLFWNCWLRPRLLHNRVHVDSRIDHFVKLVDAYDRWQDNSDLWLDATRLNKVCQAYGSKFVSHMVNKLSSIWEWSAEETSFYSEIEQQEDMLLVEAEKELILRKDNTGDLFCIIEIKDKGKLSMVCSRLLANHPDVVYCIAYYPTRPALSFRTKKADFDLTQLQGVFGHRAAAGGTYDSNDLYRLLSEDCCLSRVKPGIRKAKKIVLEKVV